MSEATEFKFTPTDKAPEPELGTERIPVDRYVDPKYMRLEDERIWSRTWLLAGAACDVAEPGDYFVFENLTESVLVTRANDGTIRAFYNVCQHRGNQLKEAGCGHTDYLICPFHRWAWNLDGTLRHVPEAHDFPQGRAQFDRLDLADTGLAEQQKVGDQLAQPAGLPQALQDISNPGLPSEISLNCLSNSCRYQKEDQDGYTD